MATNKIREIESVLGTSGRANKYRFSFAWPRGLQGNTDLASVDVLAKATTAPERELGVIELWNQGRKHVIPGDTAFSNTWSVDFYLGENHSLRYDMIQWQVACDNFHKNLHTGNPSAIFADLRVEQLDSAQKVTAVYTLHNCFPMTVGEVSYGDDSENTPTEFNVTMSFTDFVIGVREEDDFTLITPTRNDTAL